MRIEEFLFNQNIEPTFAESLVADFPNLSFDTFQEFYDFFESQGIKLIKQTKQTLPEREELLERFKNFKSSTDYDYVKKYILEERKIRDAMSNQQFVPTEKLLSGVKGDKRLDPFFYYVVRKILTGSESGELPSEKLQFLLDDLALKNKKDIDIEPDVQRDISKRIQSFDNYLKNKGSIRVELLDERFNIDTFQYVVTDRKFKSLQGAIDAEKNLLKNAKLISKFPRGTSGTARQFEDALTTLISSTSNSTLGMQKRIQELEAESSDSAAREAGLRSQILDQREYIKELVGETLETREEILANEETINKLNEVIETTLSEVEENIAAQLENTADAFDALNERIEEQNRLSEERSSKQLDAFTGAIDKIVTGLKESASAAAGTTGPTGGSTSGGTNNTSGTSGTSTVDPAIVNAIRLDLNNFLSTQYNYEELTDDDLSIYFEGIEIIRSSLSDSAFKKVTGLPRLPKPKKDPNAIIDVNYNIQMSNFTGFADASIKFTRESVNCTGAAASNNSAELQSCLTPEQLKSISQKWPSYISKVNARGGIQKAKSGTRPLTTTVGSSVSLSAPKSGVNLSSLASSSPKVVTSTKPTTTGLLTSTSLTPRPTSTGLVGSNSLINTTTNISSTTQSVRGTSGTSGTSGRSSSNTPSNRFI